MKKFFLFFALFLFLASAQNVLAHQPEIIWTQKENIEISNPEISRAFYDELAGQPRNYLISSDKDFELYVNILVPELSNKDGRYSADIFLIKGDTEEKIAVLDGASYEWKEMYEPFGRDYYLQGPEFSRQVAAGKYKIEVTGEENRGKYVLAVGKIESFGALSLLNVYWQIPLLKMQFFQSDLLQFFITPFGIAGIALVGILLVLLAIIYYLAGAIKEAIRRRQAKTLLLASDFGQIKNEVAELLQKPAYNITVAFITTASKPENNTDYLQKDLALMKEELRFNVEEIDIEGKTYRQVFEALKLKDIIFVEGGNTFYLLKAARKCKFEKVIRKLLKDGKVYIGVSAGSMIAGKTIKPAVWYGDENIINLKNLKGLNLVPFDIFVHFDPEYAEIIRKKMPWKWQRRKLKIITDQQAILVQGREVSLIGQGEQVVV